MRLLRSGAARSDRDARVPDAGMHASDRVRRVRDGSAAEICREDSGSLTACCRNRLPSWIPRGCNVRRRSKSQEAGMGPCPLPDFGGDPPTPKKLLSAETQKLLPAETFGLRGGKCFYQ